jgi:transcriptional regulator with XRE-family HTH domain
VTTEREALIPMPPATSQSRDRALVATALRRARHLAGADAVTFAELLRHRLGEPGPTPALLAAWEDAIQVPPAVVLLAAADVAGVELELLFCRRPVLQRLQELERRAERQAQELRDLLRRVG